VLRLPPRQSLLGRSNPGITGRPVMATTVLVYEREIERRSGLRGRSTSYLSGKGRNLFVTDPYGSERFMTSYTISIMLMKAFKVWAVKGHISEQCHPRDRRRISIHLIRASIRIAKLCRERATARVRFHPASFHHRNEFSHKVQHISSEQSGAITQPLTCSDLSDRRAILVSRCKNKKGLSILDNIFCQKK